MKLRLWLLPILSLTVTSVAHAGGYFSGEKGARANGRGGAFTARADDLSAVALNPAGLSDVGTTLIQVGNRFSYNSYSYTRRPTLDWSDAAIENGVPPYVEFKEVENQKPWQLLDPLVGVATNFGLRDWGFALSVYSPAGVARQEFPINGSQRYMMVNREATIVNYNLSAAWQYKDLFGVGATLQWIAVPNIKYSLVIDGNTFPEQVNPVSSTFDLRATVEGHDWFTPNAILGAWYRPTKFIELGLSGQVIPAQIETESTLNVEPLSTGITDDVVLTRDGKKANDVSLVLPLPITARLGARYIYMKNGSELFDVELDLGYESWSRVETFTVHSNGLEAMLLGQRVPVGELNVQKKWHDTMSVQIGGDYNVVPKRGTVRSGLFYESSAADPAYANVDFAEGHVIGAALGGSVYFHGFEVAAAYQIRYQLPVEVNESDARVYQVVPAAPCPPPYTGPDCNAAYQGQPSPAVNAGTYHAYSHVASLDVLYKFD